MFTKFNNLKSKSISHAGNVAAGKYYEIRLIIS